jgi:hypothetical protein
MYVVSRWADRQPSAASRGITVLVIEEVIGDNILLVSTAHSAPTIAGAVGFQQSTKKTDGAFLVVILCESAMTV